MVCESSSGLGIFRQPTGEISIVSEILKVPFTQRKGSYKTRIKCGDFPKDCGKSKLRMPNASRPSSHECGIPNDDWWGTVWCGAERFSSEG